MKIEEVLQKLAETDEPAAKSASEAKRLERHLKIVFANEFLKQTGTVAERESKARASEAYMLAHNQLHEAESERLLYQNDRATNIMRFDYWRSLNANRRQAGENL